MTNHLAATPDTSSCGYSVALQRAARLWPDRPAIWSQGQSWSYVQFAEMADRLGDWLRRRLHVVPGARVADLRYNDHRALVTEFGIVGIGALRVSVNPVGAQAEIQRQIMLTEPSVLLAQRTLAERIGLDWLASIGLPVVFDDTFDEVLAGGNPQVDFTAAQRPILDVGEPVIAIRFTGGSTGEPKAVIRTSAQQQWVAASMLADLCPMTADDVFMHTQSLSVGAHSFVLPCVVRGALQVVTERFDAEEVWRLATELGVTVLKCVPTTLRRLTAVAERQGVPDRLRLVLYGAAPAEADLVQSALVTLGPTVAMAQTYGQCEAPAVIATLTAADHERIRAGWGDMLNAVGRPYAFTDVVIVDGDGRECPTGVSGEVTVRSAIVADWTWRHGAPHALRPSGQAHRTGDLGRLTAEGLLVLEGRMNDVLVSGGYNVYPIEVERVLTDHPDVEEACVVGVPHPEWGESVCAAIVLKSGALKSSPADEACIADILGFARVRLARYKVPKLLKIVDRLPLTAANKVSRSQTRKDYFDAAH
jgi:fatty-acyl-CoA synthase